MDPRTNKRRHWLSRRCSSIKPAHSSLRAQIRVLSISFSDYLTVGADKFEEETRCRGFREMPDEPRMMLHLT
jgi:hypothetical protein